MRDLISVQRVPVSHIFVAGFSQGGALALLSALSFDPEGGPWCTLAGAVCVGGWLVTDAVPTVARTDILINRNAGFPESTAALGTAAGPLKVPLQNAESLPVLWLHGDRDTACPLGFQAVGCAVLRDQLKVQRLTETVGVGMTHSLKEEQHLALLRDWLRGVCRDVLDK